MRQQIRVQGGFPSHGPLAVSAETRQREVDPPMEGKYLLTHENSVVGLFIAAGLYLAAATSMIQRA